jgi:hypothetical protein
VSARFKGGGGSGVALFPRAGLDALAEASPSSGHRIISPSLVLSQSFAGRLWCGQNREVVNNGRSRDQFGPKDPRCRPRPHGARRLYGTRLKGQRVAGDPNLKLEARHGTDSSRIRTSGTAKTPGLWPISTRTTRRDGSRKRESGSDSRLLAPPCGGSGGVGGGLCVRFRPPGKAAREPAGAILFAFFGVVCSEPDASRARLRFKAAMRSMTGDGAAISLGLRLESPS